jgi:hypothetical protein
MILIISLLLLIALLSLNSCSQEDFHALAKASRDSWSSDPHAGVLNVPIGSNPSSGNKMIEKTKDKAQNETSTQSVASVSAYSKQTGPIQTSGNWLFRIGENAPMNATVELFQRGDIILGIVRNNNSLAIVASGSFDGNKLNLDLIEPESLNLYRLSMILAENSTNGNYTSASPIDSASKGIFKAIKLAI